MSKGIGSGDRLARGAVRATYSSTEGGVTADKWNSIFDDFNPEEFRNAPDKSRLRSNAGSEEAGDAGTDAEEIVSESNAL